MSLSKKPWSDTLKHIGLSAAEIMKKCGQRPEVVDAQNNWKEKNNQINSSMIRKIFLEVTKISHSKSKNSLNFVNTSENWTDKSIKV